MDRKIVLLIVAAIVIIAGVAYVMATQNSSVPNLTVNNSTDGTINVAKTTTKVKLHNESSHTNNNHVKNNDTSKVKISAAQAQKIAVNAIKEDFGETYVAGTPTLYTVKGTPWWHVPLNQADGTYVGSLDVNAITGETNGQW
jgi:hypothetical protein